jgi:hypothetical protein
MMEIIGYRFIRNRATGEIVGPLVPVFTDEWPYRIPPDSQPVWRYMDLWKFESMMRRSVLYFRRCDKFPDPLEGRLSDRTIHGTSKSEQAFTSAYNIREDYDKQAAAQEITRGCVFVNCWHMGTSESARMWREYTSTRDSVVIVSTVGDLRAAVGDDVVLAGVRYVPVTTPRIKFSELTVFFYKDESFEYENELRLVRPLKDGEQVFQDNEEDFAKEIQIQLSSVIRRVIMNKEISNNAADAVESLCRQDCPTAAIERSNL